MYRTLATSLLLSVSIFCQAQPGMEWGIPMSYHHLLLESPAYENLGYEYTPGGSNSPTRLYPPELNKISEAFLAHIDRQRTVESHNGPLGPTYPSSLGDWPMGKILSKRASGSLEPFGRYFMDVSKTEKITQREEGVYRDDEAFIVEGRIVRGFDTVYTQDLATGELVEKVIELNTGFRENVAGLGFTELWSYDKKKASFHKEIKYLSLDEGVFYDESYRGLRSLLNFKTAKFNKKYLGSEGLIRKGMQSAEFFDRDFRIEGECFTEGMAKSPHAIGYIEPSDRITMIMNIVEGVKSGQVSIYHYSFIDFDPATAKKASVEEFFNAQSISDTVFSEDLVTGEFMQSVVSHDLALEKVIGFQFHEDWFIDVDNFSMYKRVNGMVMLSLAKGDTGEVKGVKPFVPFYIKFNPRM
ncbi:MAG: hypothetical protein HQ500_04775 [Flavobacteriales bacterium]|nr:hypothetical protein [Flavobacteriales bacterium]